MIRPSPEGMKVPSTGPILAGDVGETTSQIIKAFNDYRTARLQGLPSLALGTLRYPRLGIDNADIQETLIEAAKNTLSLGYLRDVFALANRGRHPSESEIEAKKQDKIQIAQLKLTEHLNWLEINLGARPEKHQKPKQAERPLFALHDSELVSSLRSDPKVLQMVYANAVAGRVKGAFKEVPDDYMETVLARAAVLDLLRVRTDKFNSIIAAPGDGEILPGSPVEFFSPKVNNVAVRLQRSFRPGSEQYIREFLVVVPEFVAA